MEKNKKSILKDKNNLQTPKPSINKTYSFQINLI